MHINLVRNQAYKLYNNLARYYRFSSSYCACKSLFNIQSLIWNTEVYGQQSNPMSISRKYSTENSKGQPNDNKLPTLMDFAQITWPNIVKSIRNFILVTFIIRPYLDRDFILSDFVVASKTALELVSQRISESDFKSLDGLVTADVITNVQQAIFSMPMSQREQLAVVKDDIYFSFAYQVGIMFNDVEGQEQKRFVEITMVYHIMKGLSAMRSNGEEPPLNMGMMPEYQNRISICNYRFIREFTKGVEPKWTINLLNHFKPIDVVESR